LIAKYENIVTNLKVGQSGGSLKRCPHINCIGTVLQPARRVKPVIDQIFKVKCTTCKKDVCWNCNEPWHEGAVCKADLNFEWDLLGSKTGTAHRCPKCKSPFEKVSGCMHMTCAICQYEWCWTCGLPYKSIVHYTQAGGMCCELIGQISFSKLHYCWKLLITLAVVIFFPLLFLLISLSGGGALATEFCCTFKAAYHYTKCSFDCLVQMTNRRSKCKSWLMSAVMFPLMLINLVVVALIFVLSLVWWLLITLSVATFAFAIFMVPCYLLLLMAICRMLYVWNHNRA
jgi:hypothetical protein